MNIKTAKLCRAYARVRGVPKRVIKSSWLDTPRPQRYATRKLMQRMVAKYKGLVIDEADRKKFSL